MKYQIFGPTGNKVCIVEADHCHRTGCGIDFFEYEGTNSLFISIPEQWAAIPLESIVKDESKEIAEAVKDYKLLNYES